MIALLALLLTAPPPDGDRPQEEPPPRLTLREAPPDPPWIDFEWLELQPRAGMAWFSDDFRIDPVPFVTLGAHVPVPLFSPNSNPGGEYLGIFADVSVVPRVERDLNPPPSDDAGMLVFAGGGLDFTLLRNQSLYLLIQGGAQYGFYGGIEGLENGVAGIAGLTGGVYLGAGLTATVGSQVVFGQAGDKIVLSSVGLLIEF